MSAVEAAQEPADGLLRGGRADATVVRIVLGNQLRRLREAAGITPDQAGYAIRGSRSKISRMENGRVGFKLRDVADLLTLYGVTDEKLRAGLLGLVQEANSPGWWATYGDVLPDWFEAYIGLETAASVIRTFDLQFVSGLFQTEDYARAVTQLGHKAASRAELDRRVSLRMQRQELLRAADPPHVWSVIDEAALRRPIGGRDVMRGQLRRLTEVAALPAVTLQVMPFGRGGHAAAGGPFTILRFGEPDLPDLVYIEQLTSAIYLEVMNRVSAKALTPAETACFLRDMIGEVQPEIPAVTTSSAAPAAGGEPGGHAARDDHPTFDTSVAHQARVYDYLLGGKENYAIDRAAGDAAIEAYPDLLFTVRSNRAFLGRVVRYLAGEAGIRQFLDIGTGIPSPGNTHQVAQATAPASRVVYVDYDPVVLAHSRALLTSTPEGATGYLDADLREPGPILEQAAATLDFSQPVAIVLTSILQVIGDEADPYGIVATLLDAVPPGSYLALSHVAADIDAEQVGQARDRLNQRAYQQTTVRSHAQVARFFDGLELVEPGLVQVQEWRPDSTIRSTSRAAMWGGVGRKPARGAR